MCIYIYINVLYDYLTQQTRTQIARHLRHGLEELVVSQLGVTSCQRRLSCGFGVWNWQHEINMI